MVENKFIEGYTSAFQNAMRDIESLKEFYKRSSRTVVEYRVKLESECKEGKIISDLFDSVLRLSDKEPMIVEEVRRDGMYRCSLLKDKRMQSVYSIGEIEKV